MTDTKITPYFSEASETKLFFIIAISHATCQIMLRSGNSAQFFIMVRCAVESGAVAQININHVMYSNGLIPEVHFLLRCLTPVLLFAFHPCTYPICITCLLDNFLLFMSPFNCSKL